MYNIIDTIHYISREIDFLKAEHLSEQFKKVLNSNRKKNVPHQSVNMNSFFFLYFISYLFLKINPAGTIPALVDNSIVLCDRLDSVYLCLYWLCINRIIIGTFFFFFSSHAINLYLIEKYAKDDYLYPKNDMLLRSRINDRLFFDASFLFPRGLSLFVSTCVKTRWNV